MRVWCCVLLRVLLLLLFKEANAAVAVLHYCHGGHYFVMFDVMLQLFYFCWRFAKNQMTFVLAPKTNDKK